MDSAAIDGFKKQPAEWVDPDDAAELTDEFFEKATPMIGDRVVTFEAFAAAAQEALRRGRR